MTAFGFNTDPMRTTEEQQKKIKPQPTCPYANHDGLYYILTDQQSFSPALW